MSADYVLSKINAPGYVIWDSRSVLQYIGYDLRTNPGRPALRGQPRLDQPPGRDANGVSVLKSSAEILELLKEHGITPDKEIIIYCQAGVRSSYSSDTLLGLGFTKVTNYTGSWGEWSAALKSDGSYKYPVSTGTNP